MSRSALQVGAQPVSQSQPLEQNPCDVDCCSTGLSRCLTISHRYPCSGEVNMDYLIGSGTGARQQTIAQEDD